jgi:hypothetical protein
VWDTAGDAASRLDRDLEFGYEILVAGSGTGSGAGVGGGGGMGAGAGGMGGESWLVGGRRRGHFVIPAVGSFADSSSGGGGGEEGDDGGEASRGEGEGGVGLSSKVDTEA